MLPRASLAFVHIAGKEHDNGVKIGISPPPPPMIGMIRTRCAEDIRPGGHSLTKLFRESSQRRVIDTKSFQTIPCERHGDPSGVKFARSNRLCGTYFREDACQPGSGTLGAAKRQEFVSLSQRGRAGKQEVLDVCYRQ